MTTPADHRFVEIQKTLTVAVHAAEDYNSLASVLREAVQSLGDFITTHSFALPRPQPDPNGLLLWSEDAWQGSFWAAAMAAITPAAEDSDLRLTVWRLDDPKPGHIRTYIRTTGIYSRIAEEGEVSRERIVFADGKTVDTADVLGVAF